jgi:hypothetical protein
MRFSCMFEILMVIAGMWVIACACWLLHVHVAYLWFKQHIKDACRSKEHQLPNIMYYTVQAWKYNSLLEI